MFARCTLCKLEASNATRMHKKGKPPYVSGAWMLMGISAVAESNANLPIYQRLVETRVALLKQALADYFASSPSCWSARSCLHSVCLLSNRCGCTVIKVCEEGEGTAAQVSFLVPHSGLAAGAAAVAKFWMWRDEVLYSLTFFLLVGPVVKFLWIHFSLFRVQSVMLG